jgi:hypothetical protein
MLENCLEFERLGGDEVTLSFHAGHDLDRFTYLVEEPNADTFV